MIGIAWVAGGFVALVVNQGIIGAVAGCLLVAALLMGAALTDKLR